MMNLLDRDSMTDVIKQERYTGKSGEDLIDRWAREETSEIFRAKIMAQLDRYTSRYGKKDNVLQEAKKIQDYANRLVQYEEGLVRGKSGVNIR